MPLLVLVTSPFVVAFGLGIGEWFKVKPRFQSMGLPSYSCFNLDRDTRCYPGAGGCIARGDEWLIQSPFNGGLSLMTKIFGPPKNTYHGPYPTEQEAIAITSTAAETSPEQFLNGEIVVHGKVISLGKACAGGILNDLGMIFFESDTDDPSRHVRAAFFDQRCLIIQVSMWDPDKGNSTGIFLFDSEGFRPFARYVNSGYAPRIPNLLRN
jgi:hypothetical protein